MKRLLRASIGGSLLAVLLGVVLLAGRGSSGTTNEISAPGVPALANSSAGGAGAAATPARPSRGKAAVSSGPNVGTGTLDGVSPAVRDIPVPPVTIGPLVVRDFEPLHPNQPPTQSGTDPVIQSALGPGAMPAAASTFDGIDVTKACGNCLPPDPNGAVGPDHYVQMVNSHFAVYSKNGTQVAAPRAINSLWTGTGTECATYNDGDPIVLYDQLADRWLLSQFIATPTGADQYGECIAISTSPDPTGTYYLYTFLFGTSTFHDYPKLAVWPDAYYMTTNEFATVPTPLLSRGAGVFAFDRAAMLAGSAAPQMVYFDLGPENPGGPNSQVDQFISQEPVNLDGTALPPTAAAGAVACAGTNCPIDLVDNPDFPATTDGPAAPYPSSIVVSGLTGDIAKVTVTITGLTHSFPDDTDILLVGPTGTAVELMSDAGGGGDLADVSLTFDDSAASLLADAGPTSNGTYKPSNYMGTEVQSGCVIDAIATADPLPAPAPAAPAGGYGQLLSAFNGTSPNGTWNLYIGDDCNGDVGSLTSWSLNFTGPTASPPGYIVEVDDQSNIPSAGGVVGDAMRIWKFRVDWSNPGASTLGIPAEGRQHQPDFTLPVAEFVQGQCVYGNGPNCVPQSSAPEQLDALADRLMFRATYRNFGNREAMTLMHSVVAGGPLGIRWYEVRGVTTTPTIYQQSTYAPLDGLWRWMGSAAMDKKGDLAIGFSSSGPNAFPALRYAGRLAGDPLNELTQGEAVLFQGTESQRQPLNRWGDYSALTVDPSDGCTFWYTNEYLMAGSGIPILNASWRTRIGSFVFPTCLLPTAVEMRTFGTRWTKAGVAVSWLTASETEIAGFNLWRSSGKSWRKVNRALVPAKRAGSAGGARYRLLDRNVRQVGFYTYRLQFVDLKGKRTWYGTGSVPVR